MFLMGKTYSSAQLIAKPRGLFEQFAQVQHTTELANTILAEQVLRKMDVVKPICASQEIPHQEESEEAVTSGP